MDERILSQREVMSLTGLSRTTLYKLRRKSMFPQAIKRGEQKIGWHRADIIDWIRSRPIAL